MDPSVSALVGVVIGLGGKAALDLATEGRRDRKKARAVTRLITRELETVVTGLASWLEHGNTAGQHRQALLNFPAWTLYHETAAGSLPDAPWDLVSDAYGSMYLLRTSEDFCGDLTESARSHVLEAHQAAVAAVEAMNHRLNST
jgi:hypothetical protein